MDPLALLPYALAAAGGRTGPYDVSALVAAGVTLLQRSAPLVRALAGKRAAVLLPPDPAWLVAIAASDGRGLVLLDATEGQPVAPQVLTAERVGAVFTTTTLAHTLPPDVPRVLLDEAPHRARVVAGTRDTVVDLGSHFGLDLVGDSTGPGAPEECLVCPLPAARLTHADLFRSARAAMASYHFTPIDRTLSLVPLSSAGAFTVGLTAPLMAGGHLRLASGASTAEAQRLLEEWPATIVVMPPSLAPGLVRFAPQWRDEGRAVKRWVVLAPGGASAVGTGEREALEDVARQADVTLDWR